MLRIPPTTLGRSLSQSGDPRGFLFDWTDTLFIDDAISDLVSDHWESYTAMQSTWARYQSEGLDFETFLVDTAAGSGPFANRAYDLWRTLYPSTLPDKRAQLDHDDAVAVRVRQLEADSEARRIVALRSGTHAAFAVQKAVPVFDLPDPEDGDWLVQDVLPRYGTTMLFAEGFAGKSYVALAWGASIASGREWFGKSVSQGRVVYLALEGRATIKKRLKAWAIENGVPESELANFIVYPHSLNLLDPDVVAAVCDFIRPGDFVVVDTVAKSIGAGDATKDAGLLLQNFDAIRDAADGGGLLFVHHTKKEDRKVYRDSTRYFDDVDQVWRMMLGEEGAVENPHRILESLKNKFDTGSFERFDLEFHKVGPDSILREMERPDTSDVVRHVKSMLSDGSMLTSEQLIETYVGSKSPKTFQNHLTGMVKSSAVIKSLSRPYTYHLPTNGPADA